MTMRLQKYLAHAGMCARRKAEEHILNGRVQVNGRVVTELGTRVEPLTDTVLFDGQPVRLQQEAGFVYVALNKPEGYVTSCSQKRTKIVLDLIDLPERVYPVGRLDKDSKGLILLTNDGNLHNRLSHPSFNHEKEYRVTTAQAISDAALTAMARGLVIDGSRTRPARVRRISANRFIIILKQGRNRQIRRMVQKIGNQVTILIRTRIAHIRLGDLKEGKWRFLTPGEIRRLPQ